MKFLIKLLAGVALALAVILFLKYLDDHGRPVAFFEQPPIEAYMSGEDCFNTEYFGEWL